MRLRSIALVGLFAIAAPAGAAQAQWSYGVPGAYGGDPYDTYAHGGYERGFSRQELAASVDALCEHAEHIAHFLRAADPRSPMGDHALAVSRSARLIHNTVLSGAPLPIVDSELRQLGRELSQLSLEVAHVHHVHHGQHFQQDFGLLIRAFEQTIGILQQEVGYSRGGHRGYDSPATHGYVPPGAYRVGPPARVYRARPRGNRVQIRAGF